MELELEISGDVVERQELLNGAQMVTLEGASADGAWTLSSIIGWNIGLESNAGEGDLTLARVDGNELYGTVVSARVAERAGGFTLALRYEIDGGAGAFDAVAGSARAEVELEQERFCGWWKLSVSA